MDIKKNGHDWDDFDKFESVIDRYMPMCGEGETEASQVVTAVNKLVYKWYNDGDVFDNTHYLDGWCNDLSSYANWLWRYVGGETGADTILERVWDCHTESDYEDLLYDLAENLLDADWLAVEEMTPAHGSIYNCEGVFRFVDYCDDEEEEEY